MAFQAHRSVLAEVAKGAGRAVFRQEMTRSLQHSALLHEGLRPRRHGIDDAASRPAAEAKEYIILLFDEALFRNRVHAHSIGTKNFSLCYNSRRGQNRIAAAMKRNKIGAGESKSTWRLPLRKRE